MCNSYDPVLIPGSNICSTKRHIDAAVDNSQRDFANIKYNVTSNKAF